MGRTLKGSESRYEDWAKEVLALLRVLKVCYYELSKLPIKVYTRHSVFKWATSSKIARASHIEWSVLLAPWDIEFINIDHADERRKFSALMTVSMSPPWAVMTDMEHLTPMKAITEPPVYIGLPEFQPNQEAWVATFDGGVKLSERVGSYGGILWKLPEWTIEAAIQGVVEDATVNIAEYHGCMKVMQLALNRNIKELYVIGDSRIVIQQISGLIQCKQPHLQELLR